MDMKLEVVIVPVSDVDRARHFYEALGFRMDIDHVGDPGVPGRAAHTARLGVLDHRRQGDDIGGARLVQGLQLVVCDIKAARSGLIARGADGERVIPRPGRDLPPPRSGMAGAGTGPETWQLWFIRDVPDPDGNGWVLQEVRRAGSRTVTGLESDDGRWPRWTRWTRSPTAAETEQAHGTYEGTVLRGVYDQAWPEWYAAYAVEQVSGTCSATPSP